MTAPEQQVLGAFFFFGACVRLCAFVCLCVLVHAVLADCMRTGTPEPNGGEIIDCRCHLVQDMSKNCTGARSGQGPGTRPRSRRQTRMGCEASLWCRPLCRAAGGAPGTSQSMRSSLTQVQSVRMAKLNLRESATSLQAIDAQRLMTNMPAVMAVSSDF